MDDGTPSSIFSLCGIADSVGRITNSITCIPNGISGSINQITHTISDVI